MKGKTERKYGLACLALLLIAAMLIAPVGAVLSPRLSGAPQTATDPLDFSDPNSIKTERSAGELLAALLSALDRGESMSEAERAYLNRYCGEKLYYTALLPGDLVEVEVAVGGEEIAVEARTHTLQGRNGKTVTWIPVSATYGAQTKLLTEGKGVFSRTAGEEDLVSVSYRGEVKLPEGVANLLLNYAYSDLEQAREVTARLEAYRQEYPLWQANQQAWADYELALEEYGLKTQTYGEALRLWQDNQDAWVKYEKDKAAFDANKQAWSAYRQAWNTYVNSAEYKEYLRADGEYQEILTNQSRIRTAMMAMESIYLKPEGVRDLYSALQNSELVVMFERYKGVLITSGGVKEKDITDMRKRSDRLNELLGLYAEERAVSEQAAFTFYRENYREISELFNGLYQNMSDVLTGTVYNLMCGKLDGEYGAGTEMARYKKWRIKNVLCHIYLICLCLDDSKTPDSQWWFFNDVGDRHPYYFGDLLDQRLIIADSNASNPQDMVWREIPSEIPTPPTAPKQPEQAEMTAGPAQPAAKWDKPVAPIPPTEPAPKWAEPTLPQGVEILARVTALSGVTIEERQEITGDVTVALPSVSVTARADRPVVHGADGQERTDLDPYDLPETLPPYEDEQYTYTFVCWSASPSERLPVTADSKHIYPIYTQAPREYEVIFSVAGTEHIRTFRWGETPVFDGSTAKASDMQYDYAFSEWNPPLETVRREGMRFEAVYTAALRSYEVTFDLGYRTVSRFFPYGTVPACPVSVETFVSGNRIYEFTGAWNPTLAAVEGAALYRAEFSSRPLTQQPVGGEPQVSEGAISYTVTVQGEQVSIGELFTYAKAQGKTVAVIFADADATVSFDTDAMRNMNPTSGVCLTLRRTDDGAGTTFALKITNSQGVAMLSADGIRLSYQLEKEPEGELSVTARYAGGSEQSLNYNREGKTVEFSVVTNATYRVERIYRLTAVQGESGRFYTDKSSYRAGEKITLSAFPDAGYRVGSVTLKDPATGKTVTVTSLDELTMPAFDAELTVEFAPILYTVEFLYHGGSAKETYKRGEMPKIPTIETSYEEDGYFYTFLGWDSPVTIVTEDVTYTATYYSVPVEEKSDSGEGGAWGRILLRFGLPALLVLVGIGTGITVPLVIRSRKKKKRRQVQTRAEEEGGQSDE